MSKYRSYYKYSNRLDVKEHIWVIIGSKGALHLHISEYDEKKFPDTEKYSGGIEFHYRTPPDYMADEAPGNDQCWILKAPCWHDGSSSQALDYWIPFWQEIQGARDEHDRMFMALEKRLEEVFKDDEAPMIVWEFKTSDGKE